MIIINPSLFRIIFPWIIWKGSKEIPEVYLTFDDGPHPVYTPRILDLLKRHHAEATFFLVGEKILLYPGIVEKITKEGHTIGNHTFSHFRLTFRRTKKVREQILQTDRAIQNITGQKPVFFRPPHGRFDPRFRKLMQQLHYRMVLWSLFTYDFLDTKPIRLIQRIRENLHAGAILVFHDGHPNTSIMLDALPDILISIQQLGYRTKKLDTLLGQDR